MSNKLKRNIWIIYLFNFLKGLMFFLPIYALYLQQELFTIFNVTLILAIQSIATLIFEVPSGAIADLFGRKRSLIISSIIGVIALIFLGIGNSLIFFIIYAILTAFSESLLSGTDVALLFDTLKNKNQLEKKDAILLSESSVGKKEVPMLVEELQKQTSFKKVIALNNCMWPIGASISSMIGGILATISLKLPIWITIIPFTIASLIVFLIVEPKYEREKQRNIFSHMFNSVKIISKKKQILLLFLAGFLFYSFGEVAHELASIFYAFKNIPIGYYGFIFAGSFGLSFLGSYFSHNISEKLGNKKTIILSALLPPFLLYGATITLGLWSAVLIVLGGLCWGVRWPVITHLINLEINSKNRVTIISIGNLANKLGLAIFAPFFGYFSGLYSINVAFKLIAFLSLLTVILLFFIKEKS